MPRNKNAGKVNVAAKTDTDTLTEENENVSTATATESDESAVADGAGEEEDAVQYELTSSAAPADYSPDRKTPGRTRRPSYFDDILRRADVYGQGYQVVPVSSDDHKAFVVRELNRAKLHLNDPKVKAEGDPEIGIALDLDNEGAVYYRSRLAQKRTRKNGSEASADSDSDSEGEAETDANTDTDTDTPSEY